jgi:hypothetical protein
LAGVLLLLLQGCTQVNAEGQARGGDAHHQEAMAPLLFHAYQPWEDLGGEV